MPTTVRSHAKINLGLGIGAPRPDGFHALSTVYQTLELHDLVTVSARPAPETALRLTSNDSRVPNDNRNTAWKMIALALEALGLTAEVEIHIEKRLPVQGGLGAGSANAVAALVGLENEIAAELRLASQQVGQSASQPWPAQRLEIAAQVGSDVPLFLIGGAVLGSDRGQKVEPLPDFEPLWCVVALPEVGVSTPQAFADWDALCIEEGLTAEASTDKLNKLSRAYASAFAEAIPEGRPGVGSSGVLLDERNLAGPSESALVRTGIFSWIANDFERVVFRQHPSLAEIKRILAGPGTPEAALHASSLVASLSGSGSALFGLYLTREDAEAARERLRVGGVRSQLTHTLPREAYWRQMLLP
jgi:4-diphosphocytidyl-2-C-methyl-D-erythritol kinase